MNEVLVFDASASHSMHNVCFLLSSIDAILTDRCRVEQQKNSHLSVKKITDFSE